MSQKQPAWVEAKQACNKNCEQEEPSGNKSPPVSTFAGHVEERLHRALVLRVRVWLQISSFRRWRAM